MGRAAGLCAATGVDISQHVARSMKLVACMINGCSGPKDGSYVRWLNS